MVFLFLYTHIDLSFAQLEAWTFNINACPSLSGKKWLLRASGSQQVGRDPKGGRMRSQPRSS